jgi:hypothetical protein
MRLYLPNGRMRRPGADISDLTTAKPTGAPNWAVGEPDVLVMPFDTEPTPAEQSAIERRLTTDTPVEETLHTRALDAYQALQSYEGLTNPTDAQTRAVVKVLCKAVRALIRLQLRRLDAAD